MNTLKLFRLCAICAITFALATFSTASAQTYTQIDYPSAALTEISGGPNVEGTAVGLWLDSNSVFHGFSVTSTGTFKSFDPPGSIFTEPTFINYQGVIVGEYLDSNAVSHGFILAAGNFTVVDASGAAGTMLSGTNDLGEISGASCSDPACGNTGNASTNESFVLSRLGTYTSFNPPGATSSESSTVSLLGAVVGDYTDNVGEVNHGYLLSHGSYTTLDFPGATTGTFAGGGNLSNDVVGIYNYSNCTTDCNHAFWWHAGVYKSFDYPSAIFSEATGINSQGVIGGIFTDSSGLTHGFIRTP
jgi:hypothetical protein